MFSHNITKYEADGKKYVESWLQINIFGKIFAFSIKRKEI